MCAGRCYPGAPPSPSQPRHSRGGEFMDAEKLRVAREKITRVFRYLEALNQHRNPPKRQIREQPWHLWLHDLPVHPAVRQSTVKSNSAKAKSADGQTEAAANATFSLRIQRSEERRVGEERR